MSTKNLYYIYVPLNGQFTQDNYTLQFLTPDEVEAHRSAGFLVSRDALDMSDENGGNSL